jgi:hypothetical protein
MPKMMNRIKQMRRTFPIGFNEIRRVSTTTLRPGA